MKEIKLTRGYTALVDDEDFERLSRFNWNANVRMNNTTGRMYVRAVRVIKGSTIYMHHDVLQIEPNSKTPVDHINKNSLDNRKENLRVVTVSENLLNRNRRSNTKGYSFNKQVSKWVCYVNPPQQKRKYLGYVETEAEAIALVEAANNAYLENN